MATTSEDFEHVLHRVTNPITKNTIKLIPPAEIMNQEEYNDLLAKFYDFCKEAWEDKKDPEFIDPRKFRTWGEEEA